MYSTTKVATGTAKAKSSVSARVLPLGPPMLTIAPAAAAAVAEGEAVVVGEDILE